MTTPTLKKCPTTKTMLNMGRVLDAIDVYNVQYKDGLLARGEAVEGMIRCLEELKHRDLEECRLAIEAYGVGINQFAELCQNASKI